MCTFDGAIEFFVGDDDRAGKNGVTDFCNYTYGCRNCADGGEVQKIVWSKEQRVFSVLFLCLVVELFQYAMKKENKNGNSIIGPFYI